MICATRMNIYVTTPPDGTRWRLRLLCLFARHSQNKFCLCTRSFVKSKRRGIFCQTPALTLRARAMPTVGANEPVRLHLPSA